MSEWQGLVRLTVSKYIQDQQDGAHRMVAIGMCLVELRELGTPVYSHRLTVSFEREARRGSETWTVRVDKREPGVQFRMMDRHDEQKRYSVVRAAMQELLQLHPYLLTESL